MFPQAYEISLTGAQVIVVLEALKKDAEKWPGKMQLVFELQKIAEEYARTG